MALVVTLMLLSPAIANSAEVEKPFFYIWNKLDIVQKNIYFLGLIDGVHTMAFKAKVPFETMNELQAALIRKRECVEKDFNMIYSQEIDIPPSSLLLGSTKKCNGEFTPLEFLKFVEGMSDSTFEAQKGSKKK